MSMFHPGYSSQFERDDWDGPRVLVLKTTTPVARKEHTCFYCQHVIRPGEHYRRTFLLTDEGGKIYKEHLVCSHITPEEEAAEYAALYAEYTKAAAAEAAAFEEEAAERAAGEGGNYPNIPNIGVEYTSDEAEDFMPF